MTERRISIADNKRPKKIFKRFDAELDKLDEQGHQPAKTEDEIRVRAQEAYRLAEDPAFCRAYQTVFNGCLNKILKADTPKEVVIARDQLNLLKKLMNAIGNEINAIKIVEANRAQ